jgi:hypothetical protein
MNTPPEKPGGSGTAWLSVRLETPVRQSLAIVAVWLVIVNIFALLALNRLNMAPDTALAWMCPETYKVRHSWNVIDLHNRWDAYWYLDIAENGYSLRGENSQANVVFFPLYPLLMAALAPLAGGNLVLSGWMVSSLFLALAACMLARLTREFHSGVDPALPVVFLLAYPTAFFLNAVYSESLFLFLSLAMVYCALKRRFLLAALWAALASATRVAGVFLLVLLLVEFVQAYGWRALLTRRVWPLMLAPLGAVAFFLYHWVAFGDFFLYLKVQGSYGRDFEVAAGDLLDFRNAPDLAHTLLELFYTGAAIVLGVVALVRFRPSYGMYMLFSLAVALSTGTTLGIVRYAMVMFPIHLIGAGIRSTTGRCAWLLTSGLLLALNITRFVNHYWAG